MMGERPRIDGKDFDSMISKCKAIEKFSMGE